MSAAQETTAVDEAEFRRQAEALIRAGQFLYERGWVPATSGNFSARLGDERVAITVSGRHKGALKIDDIMVVDGAGRALDQAKRPSAETLLHTMLYQRFPEVGAVLHTHSMNATLLSRERGGTLHLEGYELLKAFKGVETHETTVAVPIFANDQNIPRLAGEVQAYLDQYGPIPGI